MLVRMYLDQARTLYLLVKYLRSRGVENLGEALDAVGYESATRLPPPETWSTNTLQEIEEWLLGLCTKKTSTQHEVNFVDKIIETLNLPFSAQWGPIEVARLNRILFDDDELQAREAIREQQELHCCGCGKTLSDKTLVTLSRYTRAGVENPPAPRIFCLQCQPPTALNCGTCGSAFPLPLGVKRALKKSPTLCAHCRPVEVEAPPAPAPAPVPLTPTEQATVNRRQTEMQNLLQRHDTPEEEETPF
jgi:hypothetical protein